MLKVPYSQGVQLTSLSVKPILAGRLEIDIRFLHVFIFFSFNLSISLSLSGNYLVVQVANHLFGVLIKEDNEMVDKKNAKRCPTRTTDTAMSKMVTLIPRIKLLTVNSEYKVRN